MVVLLFLFVCCLFVVVVVGGGGGVFCFYLFVLSLYCRWFCFLHHLMNSHTPSP